MNIFYCEDISQPLAVLDEEESRHAAKVLRARAGQPLQLTDGKGTMAEAVFSAVDIRHTQVEVTSVRHIPAPDPAVILAVSPLKNPDRLEWLVEKATECGIYSIVPMICERTEKPSVNLRRLRHIALSAMKQSLRAWLPEIPEPVPFTDIIRHPAALKLLPHCLEKYPKTSLFSLSPVHETLVCIGPEGDFTENEILQAAENDFRGISLGYYRLRSETAGMMVSVWGRSGE